MKANSGCLEGAGCETAEVNITVQVEGHMQGSFTTAPFPKPQQSPFSTPNTSSKVSTVLHFSASGRHLKRGQGFEFVMGVSVTSKGAYFHCLLTWCASPMTGREAIPEGQRIHSHGYTLCAHSNLISHWGPGFLPKAGAWEAVLQTWSPSWHGGLNPCFPFFPKGKQSHNELGHFAMSPQQKCCGSFAYMMNSISLLKVIWTKKPHLANSTGPACFLMWF